MGDPEEFFGVFEYDLIGNQQFLYVRYPYGSSRYLKKPEEPKNPKDQKEKDKFISDQETFKKECEQQYLYDFTGSDESKTNAEQQLLKDYLEVLRSTGRGAISGSDKYGNAHTFKTDTEFFSASWFLIQDYKEHGSYQDSKIIFRTKGAGRPDWRRTIKTQRPLIDDDRAVYLNTVRRRSVRNPDSEITRLYKQLLAYCTFALAPFLDEKLFRFLQTSLDKNGKANDFKMSAGEVSKARKLIIDEKGIVFETRKLNILDRMLIVLDFIDRNSNDNTVSEQDPWTNNKTRGAKDKGKMNPKVNVSPDRTYDDGIEPRTKNVYQGTYKFFTTWEQMLSAILGDPDIKGTYFHGVYSIQDEAKKAIKGFPSESAYGPMEDLRPDILLRSENSDMEENGKKYLSATIIGDAKYYKFYQEQLRYRQSEYALKKGESKKVLFLPTSSDISKQIVYALDYIHTNKVNESDVYNAFLIPWRNENNFFTFVGEGNFGWNYYEGRPYEHIMLIGVDTDTAIRKMAKYLRDKDGYEDERNDDRKALRKIVVDSFQKACQNANKGD